MLELIEAFVPESLVIAQPVVGLFHRHGIGSDELKAAPLFPGDEIGALENLQVLGNRRQGHSVGLGNFAHRQFPPGNFPQDRTAGGIRKGMKDPIELRRFNNLYGLNHMVE